MLVVRLIKMSRREYIIAAFTLAIILTWCGYRFALGWKEPPRIQMALWFPFAEITCGI
jgi:hypothetical protein